MNFNYRCTIHDEDFNTVCPKCHPKVVAAAEKVDKLHAKQKALRKRIQAIDEQIESLIMACNDSDGTYSTSKGLGVSYRTVAFKYGKKNQ